MQCRIPTAFFTKSRRAPEMRPARGGKWMRNTHPCFCIYSQCNRRADGERRILEDCATLGEIYDIVIEDMDRQSRGLVG